MAANGGSVRKLHIIYFLSRTGHVEQPHLFRVHHFSGAGGVFLRDVKRWLAELRGKEMPEGFSWSYKRKYKTGYVWQDLMDDDLITPFSDNEYVLKGSEIIPTILRDSQLGQMKRTQKSCRENLETKVEKPETPPFGSERSTTSDDGGLVKPLETAKPEEVQKLKTHNSSFYSKLLNKKKNTTTEKDRDMEEGTRTPTSTIPLSSFSSSSSSSSSGSSFTKSKSYSNGASTILRHWITCGAVDADDAVFVKNPPAAMVAANQLIGKPRNDAEIRRGDKFGGSARVLRTCWDQQLEISQHNSRKSCDGGSDSRKKRQKECRDGAKMASAAYRPIGGPNCSQCGKTFRPEKMHAHMKSCRGLKSLSTTAPSASDKASLSKSKSTSAASTHNQSASGYLLTN